MWFPTRRLCHVFLNKGADTRLTNPLYRRSFGLNAAALLSCADKKVVRETNPDEEKTSGAGREGGESRLRPGGMNPIINSTSGTNMAFISNALAAYTYISGRITLTSPSSIKKPWALKI